ncbi:unnamed protein product [Echinostoma caproni]|uniref:Uncharacterized protein n=1 Tax=Echinostoma caproni TaxID=27848 RepID=A0A3P8GU68_9TREM|nr:unnamed protein product [Echinostoma caproni]
MNPFSSMGPDGTHPRVLREAASVIAPYYSTLLQNWVAPQTADVRLPVPDPVGLGLKKAWGLHPQWTIWLGQSLSGAAISTALTKCVRIPDQVEERSSNPTYKVF